MRRLCLTAWMVLLVCLVCAPGRGLDWDKLIFLDAENLAEGDMAEEYARILPALGKYVSRPLAMEEFRDDRKYVVSAGGVDYTIYDYSVGGEPEAVHPWWRAAWTFMAIVNRQLAESDSKLYGFYAGNDFSGMFLTRAEYERALAEERERDRPYLPELDKPWGELPHWAPSVPGSGPWTDPGP